MKQDLKNTITEILEIVNQCPDSLKEKCFELLLIDALRSGDRTSKEVVHEEKIGTAKLLQDQETEKKENQEIKTSDTHVKARKFIETVGIEIINNVFYLEDGEFKPLYDDLKAKTVAESQIRISLLEALKNGLKHGEFTFSVENVRGLCRDVYKCYDNTNFATNYKKNKDLFTDDYSSNGQMKISQAGRDKLSSILKEL